MSYYYPYSSYSAYLDSRYGYYSRYYDYPYYSRYYDYGYPYYSRYYPSYAPLTYTTTEVVTTPVTKTVVADPLPLRAYDPLYDSAYWRSRYAYYDSPYYYSRYYSPYYSSRYYSP